MKPMDATETHVSDHLRSRGFTNVVYEPDGNVPPDFLINGKIAVEVRRLNQNHCVGSEAKGLEEVAIPLWRHIQQLLGNLGAPVRGESWFVYFRFSRPVEPWKTLKPQLCKDFQNFIASTNHSQCLITQAQGIEIEVICKTLQPHATMFVIAGCTDQESGGWLLSEMENNIRYCASEKSRKIEKVKSKYPEWWLALVDHIGYGLDNFDQKMFRDQVSVSHNWDKILIINPKDFRCWFEI